VRFLRRTLFAAAIGGMLVVLGLLGAGPAAAQTPAPTCFGLTAAAAEAGGFKVILGTPEDDNSLTGTPDPDFIIGGAGNDVIDGRGGDDVICGGNGDGGDAAAAPDVDDDRIDGGEGDDRINGGFGNDTIDGGAGVDMLLGDSGEPTGFVSTTDRIDGGDGNDMLVGGGDQDILRGEAGDDEIRARDTPTAVIDVVIGGLDRDTCNADGDDDVSECEAGDGRNLTSKDDLSPDNSFGSFVSARRPGSSDGGSEGSSSGGPTSDGSAARSFFFSVLPGFSPRCLPQPPLVGKRGISAFRLGERTSRSLLRPLVLPLSSRRGRFVYCNEGGGQTYLLSSRGRVRLLATTAATKRTRGVAPGDRLSALRRAYDDAERVGSGLYRGGNSSPVFFGVRAGKISFVAVSPRGLLADPADLARAVRQLRPGR
jgi:hypothetical protein